MVFAYVILHLVFSVINQEIGWEAGLQSDLFWVECDIAKSELSTILHYMLMWYFTRRKPLLAGLDTE